MYESVKINNDAANLLTLKAKEVIIPGQWPMDLDFATQEISGLSAPPPAEEHFAGYSWTRHSYVQLMNKVRELPAFNVEPIDEETLKTLGDSLTNVNDVIGAMLGTGIYQVVYSNNTASANTVTSGSNVGDPTTSNRTNAKIAAYGSVSTSTTYIAVTINDGNYLDFTHVGVTVDGDIA